MKEINCNIIQDILPLYVDDVVSPDTKELVEEHLEGCESCRHCAEAMRCNAPIPVAEELRKEEAKVFKKLKKNIKVKKIITVVLTIAVLFSVHLALILPQWCIPYDSGHIKVYEEDGVVYAEYEGIEIAGSAWTQMEDGDYEGKTHEIFYFYENGWSKFIEPILSRINPPDEKERKFIIGNADEIEAVYYGEFSLMHKPFSFKSPAEEVAESEKQKEDILKTNPVWGE